MDYNKKAKTWAKVTCSKCNLSREIYRIGGDNSKLFYCEYCSKMVKPLTPKEK